MRWHPKHARPHQWFVKDGRPSLGRVAAAALAVATVVGVTAAIARGASSPAPKAKSPAVVVVPIASPTGDDASASSSPAVDAHPVSIDIPVINVHTTLQTLGLDASGALEPPTNLTEAGWYTGSSVPGQNGPSVIAGHVDSFNGPAVFFNVKSLNPGDRITVGLSSGQSVAFQVMLVQHYPKTDFPTQDVYGARPDPELRLITCGGAFADGHYLDNIVVYAALAK
ncbi:class F sortase [Actinocrinis sp.]|jgi:sortase (surface protein transpeptidase)|uniref:class F sortase n=1 Tax=Actinocrinis sp. TaxID=1920516 RepID=UPI002D04B527|nr:class F sortase [Actinocrinis sp.]HXR71633.1 class F sortase [Actinocrinis sp.]